MLLSRTCCLLWGWNSFLNISARTDNSNTCHAGFWVILADKRKPRTFMITFWGQGVMTHGITFQDDHTMWEQCTHTHTHNSFRLTSFKYLELFTKSSVPGHYSHREKGCELEREVKWKAEWHFVTTSLLIHNTVTSNLACKHRLWCCHGYQTIAVPTAQVSWCSCCLRL